MKRMICILAFSSASAVAGPLAAGPGLLTPQQIIAHRQGVDIEARRSAAEAIAGFRSDEFTPFNPGSSLARFLFNTTVINSIPQSSGQTNFPTGNNLSSVYLNFIENNSLNDFVTNASPNPFESKIGKSPIQGLVFLNSSKLGVITNPADQQTNSLRQVNGR